MIDRKTKLRIRRNIRKSRRQVEDLSIQAEDRLERLFIRRLYRLLNVRKFILTWIVLIMLLIGLSVHQLRTLRPTYLVEVPAAGGTFTEGVLGSFTNANPIYAIGGVDGGVSRLLFSSLLEYNAEGELVGDLAESWSVNENSNIYEVVLRDDATWHDGQPVTVDDVAFTYKTIQNPDARSPLFSSWRDVNIKTDGQKIIFTLPNVFAAFPHSLTNGIVPKHILESIAAEQLRSDQFNTANPIGSGPFKWDAIEVSGNTPEKRQEYISLAKNPDYYKGEPKLERYVVRTFREESLMTDQFQERNLAAMSGLESVSDELPTDSFEPHTFSLTGAVMVFFKTTNDVLKDTAVRRALVQSVDVPALTSELNDPVARVNSPLLRSQLGYLPDVTQYGFNIKQAKKLLDDAGWKMGSDGIRQKGDKQLKFSLKAPSTSEFTQVTQKLREYWQAIGADVRVDQPGDNELQSIISLHQYDAVLYSISIGADPDVFAFWHSSQADVRSENRLNLSEYQSDIVDQSLEGGRTRVNPALRSIKYKPFLEQWRKDAPALALYQPNYLFVTRGDFAGLEQGQLHSSNDRYNNVENWTIRTKDQYKYNR